MTLEFRAYARNTLNYVDAGGFASPQAAIDFALENLKARVHLNGNSYSVDDTIHLGYGVGELHSIQLLGQMGYGFAVAAPETRILASFVDRPVVNIQGGRNSGIDSVYIQGADNIGYQGGSSLAVRSAKATYTPDGAADFENSPHCGVCIDAYYSTPAPANPYPTPTYPAYLGAVSGAYNRLQSSASFITNSLISDTFIGIMQQPYTDGNGDFTRMANTCLRQLYICIAVGNSQGRSADYTNIRAATFHTFVDGTKYGHGVGNIGGNFSNVHLDDFYQIFNFRGDWTTPFVVTNLYCEVGMRIGDMGAAMTKFVGCKFDTLSHLSSGGLVTEEYAPSVLSGKASFDTCQFYNRRHVFDFEHECRFDYCLFTPTPGGPAPTGALLEAAWGVLGGVINTPDSFNDKPATDSRFRGCILRGPNGSYTFDGYDTDTNANIWSVGQNPANYPIKYDFPQVARISNESLSGTLGTAGTAAGHTLTLPEVNQAYFEAGDVFCDWGLRWWYVSEVTGSGPYVVTLKALTGYRSPDGTNYWLMKRNEDTNEQEDSTQVLTTAMYYIPRGFRDFLPRDDLFFKTTSGSPTLEIVNAAGVAQNVPAGVTVKSKPLWWAKATTNANGRIPFPPKTYVSAVNAQTLTMTANALVSGTWAYGPGIARIA